MCCNFYQFSDFVKPLFVLFLTPIYVYIATTLNHFWEHYCTHNFDNEEIKGKICIWWIWFGKKNSLFSPVVLVVACNLLFCRFKSNVTVAVGPNDAKKSLSADWQCLLLCWLQVGCVHSVTSAERRRWCVNTGSEDCARRETSASFSMNTTWPRCLNVTSTPSLVCSFRSKLYDCIAQCIIFLWMYCVYVTSLSGECSNKECPFLHIDPESKIKDCPWYDRGFCKHGESCFVTEMNDSSQILHKYQT